MRKIFGCLILLLLAPLSARALDPDTLPQVGYHPGGIAYWDIPYFANAAHYGGWIEYQDGTWGSGVSVWQNPQFDANGYPQFLNPGYKLRATCYALHSNYWPRPSTWPRRSTLAEGHVVLTWAGDADIRLNGGTYLAGESSGASTGSLVDGRRVYRFTGGAHLEWFEIHAINPADPITDIKVWLSDPADPQNQSLEGQTFHPLFLDQLAAADWGFIRFMNWLETNANPQQDWSDRRPPAHLFMQGALNPREPAPGSPGDRGSGVAYEMMAQLCNATNKDLWVTVPHLATDDHIRKLAQLIRFGSDGNNPYTAVQADPVHPPLDPSLRVYVEYSNEIWAGGYSFPQGDWAYQQAQAAGITKEQFNARRFCEVWQIFQEVFGGTDRLVRVAAVFTAADWYTGPFLSEIASYGPTLTPPVEPDVIAVTTYFGNGVQDYAHTTAQEKAGTSDPWFYTTGTFDVGGGNMRPVSLDAADPYWLGTDMQRHLGETLDEWKRRLLSGDAREGGGPDAVGVGGGFDQWLRHMALTTFPDPVPIVAYEGGPSVYTDYMDGGDARDDGITIFMEAMNRRPEMADVYRIHLNMAKSRGLRSHVAFTSAGVWGKYGQWGHLETLDQDPATSPKHRFLLDWINEANGLRHVDDATGAVPQFDTPHFLPVGIVGQPYSADVAVSGGDGTRMVELIGEYSAPGLDFDPLPSVSDTVRISGTATEPGLSYYYLRVVDVDGDPAWRTFTVRMVGGPGVLVESDFTGTNPSQNLPWMPTYYRANPMVYSGWTAGAGVNPAAGDNGFVYALNMPADEANATLALSLAEQEYLSVVVQATDTATLDLRDGEVRFTIRRIDYHAPRRYAVFTSVGGFTDGAQVYESPHFGGTQDQEYVFNLPNTAAYDNLSAPVEIRIYGYSGQYGGHKTSLIAFTLGGAVNGISRVPFMKTY